jgi:hypothetical protein
MTVQVPIHNHLGAIGNAIGLWTSTQQLAEPCQRAVATTKAFTLLGTYIHRQHGSRCYGKAMNRSL